MAKILVAEDDPSIAALYKKALGISYAPDDLLFAVTGDAAISQLEEMAAGGETPNLVITDNKMPGLKTGLDVVAYAAANRLPVIMIASGNREMSADQLKSTALQKGASAFLEKPVRLNDFLDTVKTYVK